MRAVLGPTNTGKTHLAIERMCGHSSGMMGFPLRLLAREVYDRVRSIKGDKAVALITGEERIEPPQARYFLCTAEAMPRTMGEHAFVAIDEAQLGADPERGHIFTDRLLHARGREETMILGSATLEPMIKALIPKAEITTRPRFSTLSHAGICKLSRLPKRSAVVAFSVEQVYAMAEALRRFRGGAAVVMGALSPETRNKQVELFQSGEVDYIVATDAIGMGLNLDLDHVAFAALAKFDGRRKRRLTPSEMAQIAGRAGRHQRDGTFGTLSGMSAVQQGEPLAFTDEEIYATEEHRFAPLTHLFWREAEPRFDTLGMLIADLESRPDHAVLRGAPEAIDLAVLKRLAEDPVAQGVGGAGAVRRFWEACSLPDFRSLGVEQHARFVARLWQDLGQGYLGADFVAARIAELDRMQGDIDTLQGRIAAVRSWAYICQRPDWVLARDEMAARARAVEAKLSDALHARLTERFVNRRTTLLMKSLGQDASALPVTLEPDGHLTVEGESIGRLEGFRFHVDPSAGVADRRMLLAAGEKALPALLASRAEWLLTQGLGELEIAGGAIRWQGQGQGRALAEITFPGQAGSGQAGSGQFGSPRLALSRDLALLPEVSRASLEAGLAAWLEAQLEPLAPLRKLAEAARDPEAGSQARALIITLIEARGVVSREEAGLEHLPKEMRPFLRKLGVTFGALDIFAAPLLKPAPRRLLHALGLDQRAVNEAMLPVLAEGAWTKGRLPAGYRFAGTQAIRVDLAEKILRAAFDARAGVAAAHPKDRNVRFPLDLALAVSIGLEAENARRLLGNAGFHCDRARPLPEGAHGAPAPDRWHWRPRRPGERGEQRGQNRGDRQGNRRGKAPEARAPGSRDHEKDKAKDNGIPDKRPEKRPGKGERRPDRPARPAPKPDTGPARAGGAFDKLADLLRG
ncbi:ATP-dependent RNA helicase SUPV3L1/SUV3 [Erythrobacter sanguineus]|uniref:ATP-dependent RNA helicase SUPV3L1/SUV3 n=2 Tax=Erythrobacter sanguineus TaxID=198312 RepID=A0A1M7SV01_9SPHN|nr:ATP-dependent RNA helicase SUPV3L1/SUV3 [Erythrobacter sanguineus]